MRSSSGPGGLWLALGLLAVSVPVLLGVSVPPTSTFLNQLASALGMGGWLLVWALVGGSTVEPVQAKANSHRGGLSLLMAVLLALALAQGLSSAPWGQRILPVGLLLLAAVLAWVAGVSARAGRLGDWAAPLMLGLLVAGLLSTLIGLLQVFWPAATGNALVAYPTIAGRAVGNMRQPNQLSTLLLWAMAAAVWWPWGGAAKAPPGRDGPWRLRAGVLALLTLGVLLTSSRTGMLGMAMLALWGLLDRRLPTPLRWVMALGLPLLYALGWWGMEQWSASTGQFFYGDDQVKKTLHGDPSSSRGRIWANTLALIAQHPWTGVGAGAYNFIWSMTPFPGRPVAFFDHSHNLPMQLAVESGLPFALLVLAGMAWAFWRGRAGWTQPDDVAARGVRSAGFALLVVGVHSLLEYPLWYSYFLLPAAVMAGWVCSGAVSGGLNRVEAADDVAVEQPGRSGRTLAGMAGALALLLGLWTLQQYYVVAVVFDPSLSLGEVPRLQQRIARGQRSILFGHQADYAEVTMAEHPERVFDRFDRTAFHLMDTRLMMAYAKALAARGDLAEARHVAARLREFHNPASEAFFAPCEEVTKAELPFQCGPDPQLPAESLRPRDLARRPAAR